MAKQFGESAVGGKRLTRHHRIGAAAGLLAFLLTLSACNTVYDHFYFSRGRPTPEHPVEIDWQAFRRSGRFERESFARAQRDLQNLRMADLLLAHLRQEFPRDTTPRRLVAWLEWDGFRCGSVSSGGVESPGRIECAMRRVMHVSDVLFAHSTGERIWFVEMTDVTPVLGTVHVTVLDPPSAGSSAQ